MQKRIQELLQCGKPSLSSENSDAYRHVGLRLTKTQTTSQTLTWEDNVKPTATQHLVKSLIGRNMYSAEQPKLYVICISSKTWKFILKRTSGLLHTRPALLQLLIKFSCYTVLIYSANSLHRVMVKKQSYEAHGIYCWGYCLFYKPTPLLCGPLE